MIDKEFYDEEYFSASNTKSGFPGGYEDNVEFSLFAFDLNKKFSPRSTFELGCAKGFIIDKLRSYSIDASGVDISEYATQGKNLICGDAADIEYPKVDLIYSKDFFEHLTEEQITKVLSKLNKGMYNYHVITIGKMDYGDISKTTSDKSHISIYSCAWWLNKFLSYDWIIDLHTDNNWSTDGDKLLGNAIFTLR